MYEVILFYSFGESNKKPRFRSEESAFNFMSKKLEEEHVLSGKVVDLVTGQVLYSTIT